MNDVLLDRQLGQIFANGPQTAPSALVNHALERATRTKQRVPRLRALDLQSWPPAWRSLGHPEVQRGLRLAVVTGLIVLALALSILAGAGMIDRAPDLTMNQHVTLVSAGALDAPLDVRIAVAIPDGRILVPDASRKGRVASLFDPRTGTSVPVDSGIEAVSITFAGLLPDGRVALYGQEQPAAGAQRSYVWLVDPAGARATRSKLLATGIEAGVAVLADGRLLISGGYDDPEAPVASAAVDAFDPRTGTLTALPPLGEARAGHHLLSLPDGRLLVVGGSALDGTDGPAWAATVEAYDAATGLSTAVGTAGFTFHVTTAAPVKLVDGRVLIPGEQLSPQVCCRHGIDPTAIYLFDPVTNAYGRAADVPHSITVAVALRDGRALMAGNWQGGNDPPLSDAWLGIYDPAIGLVQMTPDPVTGVGSLPFDTDRSYAAGVLLPDGSVGLIAGPNGDSAPEAIDIFRFGG
jgi:hypothetical protein